MVKHSAILKSKIGKFYYKKNYNRNNKKSQAVFAIISIQQGGSMNEEASYNSGS